MSKRLGTTTDINGNVVRRWMGTDKARKPSSFRRVATIQKNQAVDASARDMIDLVLESVPRNSGSSDSSFQKGYERSHGEAMRALTSNVGILYHGDTAQKATQRFFERELRLKVDDLDGGSYDHMESNSGDRMSYLKG